MSDLLVNRRDLLTGDMSTSAPISSLEREGREGGRGGGGGGGKIGVGPRSSEKVYRYNFAEQRKDTMYKTCSWVHSFTQERI